MVVVQVDPVTIVRVVAVVVVVDIRDHVVVVVADNKVDNFVKDDSFFKWQ